MGAWGSGAFENDFASDWVFGLEQVDDLSIIEEAFDELENAEAPIESDVGCVAIAACEVLARLIGRPESGESSEETVDEWVAGHPQEVPAALRQRAVKAIDRVMAEGSELRDLWDEAGDKSWLTGVKNLRKRLSP
ncbi:MAG: DUF4259 domain-containing protein [Phycisphaerae bacterium]|nr:DUF4259 domain-containing protein [Phycisphaerae bacterium]